jgi:tol-pal system protein YbgF
MKIKITALFFGVFLFAGCATVPQTEITDLKKELAQLQIKFNQLESRQADLFAKYESGQVTNDAINASNQELFKKISQLSQKVQDLEIIQKKSASSSGGAVSVQTPTVIYQNAYNDYLVGKYELALTGFKSFIKKYPEHELAPKVQYYIGECLYSQNNWKDAYEEYKTVDSLYNGSEFSSSARLKMALCLELLGRKQDAQVVFKSILVDYPKSPESFTAKEKLKMYAK